MGKTLLSFSFLLLLSVSAVGQHRVYMRSAKGKIKSIEKTQFYGARDNGNGIWVPRDAGVVKLQITTYGRDGRTLSIHRRTYGGGALRDTTVLTSDYVYVNGVLANVRTHGTGIEKYTETVQWTNDTTCVISHKDNKGNNIDATTYMNEHGFPLGWRLSESDANGRLVHSFGVNFHYDHGNIVQDQHKDYIENKTNVVDIRILKIDNHGNPLRQVKLDGGDSNSNSILEVYRYEYYQ